MVKSESSLVKSVNILQVRHFRKCSDFVYWIEQWKLPRVRGTSVSCYASNQRVHCSVDLPNETTSSATERLVWTSNTLTHDIHTIFIRYSQQHSHTIFIESAYSKIKESITVSIDTNHFKNSLKYLSVCNWRYLNLASFTLSKLSQFNPWVDNHATCMFKVLCILADIERTCLPEGTCSVCEKVYKYEGKYLLRRIPHASHGSFNPFAFAILNK